MWAKTLISLVNGDTGVKRRVTTQTSNIYQLLKIKCVNSHKLGQKKKKIKQLWMILNSELDSSAFSLKKKIYIYITRDHLFTQCANLPIVQKNTVESINRDFNLALERKNSHLRFSSQAQ